MQGSCSEVLIIGAGPAGLAAASACSRQNVKYRIFESGEQLKDRSRTDAFSIVQGTGGAGLYSDGKFSFFPSATSLWKLDDSNALKSAYRWFENLVANYGLNVPPYKSEPTLKQAMRPPSRIRQKRYSSNYMSFENRVRLINSLELAHHPQIANKVSARLSIRPNCNNSLICEVQYDDGTTELISNKLIVFAAGRHGPMALQAGPDVCNMDFRQVELGLRLEQRSEDFFLREQTDLDPKLFIEVASGIECRTFCCCREGEAVTTRSTEDVLSVSGRADVGKTGRSNIGFNLRVTDEKIGALIWNEYRHILGKQVVRKTDWLPANQLTANTTLKIVEGWVGSTAASLLMRGLCHLVESYPKLQSNPVRLLGPCVEGVGWYPSINNALRVDPFNLWVAGDATGIFRGLTASFVSGYYAGLCAAREGALGARNTSGSC